MVNAFDYVTFIHRLTWDLPGTFWKKREIINFHNYWFLIWPSYYNLSEIIPKRTVFSAIKFTEVRHRVHTYWIWMKFYDRLYITFIPIKFHSYPISVYSMSNFSEFDSRKDRSFWNYFRKIVITWSNWKSVIMEIYDFTFLSKCSR
jgi:hypothetical protein